jgi:hypothetical protein
MDLCFFAKQKRFVNNPTPTSASGSNKKIFVELGRICSMDVQVRLYFAPDGQSCKVCQPLCSPGVCRSGPCSCISLYVSYSKLACSILPRIPAPISGNLYSKRVSLSWGAPAPFHYPPPHLKLPRLRST